MLLMCHASPEYKTTNALQFSAYYSAVIDLNEDET